MEGKSCFVIIGYGKKTSYASGKVRVLDLDETYTLLLKPVFDKLKITCYRAIDKNLSGSIDKVMLQEIKNADIALVDLSTLNANVMWELGVRHAFKPYHTIMICEKEQMGSIPFDINHFPVHEYIHTEEGIPHKEVKRFRKLLTNLVISILANKPEQVDSPVYTFLADELNTNKLGKAMINEPRGILPFEESDPNIPKMELPVEFLATIMNKPEQVDSPVYRFLKGELNTIKLEKAMRNKSSEKLPFEESDPKIPKMELPVESFATIMEKAELAKKDKNYTASLEFLKIAKEFAVKNMTLRDNLPLIISRQALYTYKSKLSNELEALINAKKILEELNPLQSHDIEVLGLSGAINKSLFEITNDSKYLDSAIRFYEKGFQLKQDYYNGINVAFMLYKKAALLKSDNQDWKKAIVKADYIRDAVLDLALEMESEGDFLNSKDAIWVILTIAEAYNYQQDEPKQLEYEQKAKELAIKTNDSFAMGSYEEQKEKIEAIFRIIRS